MVGGVVWHRTQWCPVENPYCHGLNFADTKDIDVQFDMPESDRLAEDFQQDSHPEHIPWTSLIYQ